MELRDYANALRRHWLGIVLLTVLGLAASYGWAAIQTPVYHADASGVVRVRTAPGEVITPGANETLSNAKVPTYLEMASWRSVAEKAAETLNLPDKPESLVQRVTVDNPPGTPILKVTAAASTAGSSS